MFYKLCKNIIFASKIFAIVLCLDAEKTYHKAIITIREHTFV